MPELPEVETIKADLKKSLLGLSFQDIHIYDQRVIKDLSKAQFIKKVKGQSVVDIQRRGKAVILFFKSGNYLIVQVKMTGHLVFVQKRLSQSKDTKVTFKLSNGHYLNYNDQRLFGWLIWTDDLKKISYLQTIGPEPLEDDFNIDWLTENLKKRKSPIKTLLMNQNFLAGIGNIYASEILFAASIHPEKSSFKLKQKEIRKLYHSTTSILEEAIAYRGTSMRNYRDAAGEKGAFINRIKVYGKEGQPCPRCQKPVTRIVQSNRSTFFCQNCQR